MENNKAAATHDTLGRSLTHRTHKHTHTHILVPASRMGSPLPRNQSSVVLGLESSAVHASDTALPERRGSGSSSTTRFGGTAGGRIRISE